MRATRGYGAVDSTDGLYLSTYNPIRSNGMGVNPGIG
jgi:hypothetical protein